MTRQEAIEKLQPPPNEIVWGMFGGPPGEIERRVRVQIAEFVDRLVSLGLLKLDEPISPEGRLAQAFGWPIGGRSHGQLLTALERAGLKIVEKDGK